MGSCHCFAFRFLDGSEDLGVGPATANVAAHPFPNLIIAIRVILFQERNRGTNLPGRAIAALETVMFDERRLHRMQFVAVGQTFDGCDLIAVVRHGEAEAGINPPAIY
jgi:hypothetical protein